MKRQERRQLKKEENKVYLYQCSNKFCKQHVPQRFAIDVKSIVDGKIRRMCPKCGNPLTRITKETFLKQIEKQKK